MTKLIQPTPAAGPKVPAFAIAPPRGRLRVTVVGGGASGAVLAARLLSRSQEVQVTIVEAGGKPGRGLAYATNDPEHLLNSRAMNMSAFPQDPEHFYRWLVRQRGRRNASPDCFADRATYGAYLGSLLDPWKDDPDRLTIINGTAVGICEDTDGTVVELDWGKRLHGDVVVLATGYGPDAGRGNAPLSGSLDEPHDLDPDARVVIIGSGLSMVDRVVSLRNAGHRGGITVISRRGLMPRRHTMTRPVAIDRSEVPVGQPVSMLARWIRTRARDAEGSGGTWQEVIDAVRPHASAIWRAMSQDERSRFLRHAVVWWDVHRHRIPPRSAAQIDAALADGQLSVVRGSFRGARLSTDGRTAVEFVPAGQAASQLLTAGAVFDCRGRLSDATRQTSALTASLLQQGLARVDPLQIGLDVDPTGRLISKSGLPSDNIFMIGPASRSCLWEITALPDIREQAAAVTAIISAQTAAIARHPQ